MSEDLINLTIDDKRIRAPATASLIEAIWYEGETQVLGTGCMRGVCGSCRVMVRRKDSSDVTLELACETVVEDGMQATFLSHLDFRPHHAYRIDQFDDSWDVLSAVNRVFPEAPDCRHCGGCDAVCPKDIEVQRGVVLAAEGRILEAGSLFEECVMCNLCTRACPEHIGPNHLGLLCRRLKASLGMRPANLLLRLEQLRRGELTIDL